VNILTDYPPKGKIHAGAKYCSASRLMTP
jgi:hypothetical protein